MILKEWEKCVGWPNLIKILSAFKDTNEVEEVIEVPVQLRIGDDAFDLR